MHKYVLKRLLMLIPVIIGVTFVVFFILNLAPGDPAAIILGDQATAEALAMKREELGLNDPIFVRYAARHRCAVQRRSSRVRQLHLQNHRGRT